MILPAAVGVGIGAACFGAMKTLGMLRERSGVAVFLAAVAVFFPVFAIVDGDAIAVILSHGVIALAFIAWAALGFSQGMPVLAAGLIMHGVFDGVLMATDHPGPIWWPPFCAGVDVSAGALLLWAYSRKSSFL